jgi:hypothetical protein
MKTGKIYLTHDTSPYRECTGKHPSAQAPKKRSSGNARPGQTRNDVIKKAWYTQRKTGSSGQNQIGNTPANTGIAPRQHFYHEIVIGFM